MSGKGSGRRPPQISDDEERSNWDRIFGKKPKTFDDLVDKWKQEEQANRPVNSGPSSLDGSNESKQSN